MVDQIKNVAICRLERGITCGYCGVEIEADCSEFPHTTLRHADLVSCPNKGKHFKMPTFALTEVTE